LLCLRVRFLAAASISGETGEPRGSGRATSQKPLHTSFPSATAWDETVSPGFSSSTAGETWCLLACGLGGEARRLLPPTTHAQDLYVGPVISGLQRPPPPRPNLPRSSAPRLGIPVCVPAICVPARAMPEPHPVPPGEASREPDLHLWTSSDEPGAQGFLFNPPKSTVSSPFLLPWAISPFLLFYEYLIVDPSFVLVYQSAYNLWLYAANRIIYHNALY